MVAVLVVVVVVEMIPFVVELVFLYCLIYDNNDNDVEDKASAQLIRTKLVRI